MNALDSMDMYQKKEWGRLERQIVLEYTRWGYCDFVNHILEQDKAPDSRARHAMEEAGLQLVGWSFGTHSDWRELARNLREAGQIRHRQTLDGDAEAEFCADFSGILSLEAQERRDCFQKIDRLHGEMVEVSSQIQAEWAGNLKKFQDTLGNMQNELYAHLRSWQKALYPRELEPLAQCYTALYRMVHRQADLLTELEKELSPEGFSALSKQQHNLEILLDKLEAAMVPLGINVFMSYPGDFYDSEYHEAMNTKKPREDAEITRVYSPTLLRTSVPKEDPEVLVLGQVDVKTK